MPDDTVVILAYSALVVLGIIIVITAIRLVFILLKRQKRETSPATEEKKAIAESAIEAVELMIEKKRSQNYDVSEAVEWLNDARDLFEKHRYTSCLDSLEAAKVSLEDAKKIKVKKVKVDAGMQKLQDREKEALKEKKSVETPESRREKKEPPQRIEGSEEKLEEKSAIVTEDEKMKSEQPKEEMSEAEMEKKREEIKKELESIQTPEEEMSTEALIKKKMPKDYLPAKFEIGVAETKIKEAEASGKDTEIAKKHLADAKAFFESGQYSEALGSAVKSKKALGVGKDEHIPLEPEREGVSTAETTQSEECEEEVIEVTVESGMNICINCGSHLKPGDKFCRKCGRKVELEVYCTKCGTRAEPDDLFCGKCGTKLRK